MIIALALAGWCLFLSIIAYRLARYWRREYIKAYLRDYRRLEKERRLTLRLPQLLEDHKKAKAESAKAVAIERAKLKVEVKEEVEDWHRKRKAMSDEELPKAEKKKKRPNTNRTQKA